MTCVVYSFGVKLSAYTLAIVLDPARAQFDHKRQSYCPSRY